MSLSDLDPDHRVSDLTVEVSKSEEPHPLLMMAGGRRVGRQALGTVQAVPTPRPGKYCRTSSRSEHEERCGSSSMTMD